MLLSALANQCHSFAMLVATSLLPCHSYAILCQAIAFHRIAFQRFAFPLHNTANLRHAMPLPLVACQNFASPLPIKTVLRIPSPSSSPHNFAIAFPLFARPIHAFSMLCSCKSLLIDARPLQVYVIQCYAVQRSAVALLSKSTPSHFAAVHRFALP